jgi:hypothetical protein
MVICDERRPLESGLICRSGHCTCSLSGDGIRAAANSLRLPINKRADHQMLQPESCVQLNDPLGQVSRSPSQRLMGSLLEPYPLTGSSSPTVSVKQQIDLPQL